MDVFTNVLEGTRQYFMGLPKPAEGRGPNWAPSEEGATLDTPSPSAPPATVATPPAQPPRPPSEPLEPEPHIIHKATVMREAAEKRREQPPDDDDDPPPAMSPPSHIIHKPAMAAPAPAPVAASPAPAPAAPSPSPARPPSTAPSPCAPSTTPSVPTPQPVSLEPTQHTSLEAAQYRAPLHRGHTPTARPANPFAPGRPPDPYAASRPPEPYARYPYETSVPESGRGSLGPPAPSPPRHASPQTYARLSSSMPQHTGRAREPLAPASTSQRYAPVPVQPPPLPNDRVPPIHHPTIPSPQQRLPADGRVPQYPPLSQRREPSPYSRTMQYDRHPQLPPRKYDPSQAYSGYRPAQAVPQPAPQHQPAYKHVPVETAGIPYPTRPLERTPAPPQPYTLDSRHPHESSRRAEYPNMSRPAEPRPLPYHYPTPAASSSSARYAPPAGAPVQSSSTPSKSEHRAAAAPKSNYEHQTSNHVQTSPARSNIKPGYPNQQARMTVSVTSLVNQMNQTKQKRESPLDLSVKTVKNSADSSTTQDDMVDSATTESKTIPLQPRPPSNSRHATASTSYESHKVDFAPDFSQYRDRSASYGYAVPPATAQPNSHQSLHPVRYNGSYEHHRPVAETYPAEPRHHGYPDRSKYNVPPGRHDRVPRIDLTRPAIEERRPETKIRDDRHFLIGENRKRPTGPIISNIPEKIVRYETWAADSRIDHMSLSAREQHELMSRPVYSYSSHKQFEAYQNEQKRATSTNTHREHYTNHRYPYPVEPPPTSRERADYNSHYHDRNMPSSHRHVIQKIPSHRDIHPQHTDPQAGVPADKRVLSILRNSLETKQGFMESPRPARQIRDVIVIDDDPEVDITDLTREDMESTPKMLPRSSISQNAEISSHIQMPKAVDSLPSEYQRYDHVETKSSPENDVASRIRTKAELKGLPPSEMFSRPDPKYDQPEKSRLLPKSQKQHLFNQIREDLRLESVIKGDKPETSISEVKHEPMNIDEIERDAIMPIKTETILEPPKSRSPSPVLEDDLDWASACDNFMEQLKTGCHKKKSSKKRSEADRDDDKTQKTPKIEPSDSSKEIDTHLDSIEPEQPPLVAIKQEPIDQDEIKEPTELNGEATCNSSTVEPSELPAVTIKVESKIEDTLEKTKEKSTTKRPTPDTPNKDKEKNKAKKSSCLTKDDKKSVEEKKTSPTKVKKTQKIDNEKEADNLKLKKKSLSDTKDDKPKLKKKSLCEANDNKPKLKKKTSPEEKLGELKLKKKSSEEKNGELKVNKKSSPETDNKVKSKKKSICEENDEKLKKKPLSEDKEKEEANEKRRSKFKKSLEKESPSKEKGKIVAKNERNKLKSKDEKADDSLKKVQSKSDKIEVSAVTVKKEPEEEPLKNTVKEEPESTDDDEPLIKSKIQKENKIKYQLLKDLSEKSAYVKLECFDVDLNKNTRISIDSLTKDKEDRLSKGKSTRQSQRAKGKLSADKNGDSSSTSDDEDTVITRLRGRKSTKTEDGKAVTANKTPVKGSPKKQDNGSTSSSSTPVAKPGFGDGSDFRPGWEEELYRYKQSLRMPQRLIAIPRGRSGGPFARGSGAFFSRGSTSLPDLDPAPLSPAPSLAPSAATDDLYARRPDKHNLDSDLDSNSSWSPANRLHYDSEASSSTVFSSTKAKKKGSSIVDVLIQKCGKVNEASKKKIKEKEKDDKLPKMIPKSSNANELLATPSLGLVKNNTKGILSAKKEKLMEDIFYLGAFRKETVTAFRNDFIKNTEGLLGAMEEFSPVVLKSRTRTESRVLKQRATIKEVFGDERPASAPPTSCRDEDQSTPDEVEETPKVTVKKEPEVRPKLKPKQIIKDKLKRRSSSIRDGLRSTKSLKRNDAKGRLMRLKKRNSLMKSLANKRLKDLNNKVKKEKTDDTPEDTDKPKDESSTPTNGEESGTKRRLKRLFGRRKYSSGFDYIRKKKKIIRREETPNNKFRRPGPKPSPESVHDIQKEIKSWFINKSVGETHLHRAARLGYTDCVAYCLEKMQAEPSSKDNAGFTPLHVAAAKGYVRIGKLLLQYGANVSAAAQGGIRPLHEACENNHVEMMRLLLAYGADPLLGTYAGQTPEELTEGVAARFLKLHMADVQGKAIEPWKFPAPTEVIDLESLGCDPLSSPPPSSPAPPPDATIEVQCTEAPLPPFYSLRNSTGQPYEGLWCLFQDITNLLQIKSKESLLKQIHCGSGSPKELFREIRTQEFLERAQCHQLLSAGEKVNVRASKVALVRVTDKLRQLLKIETVLVS